MARRRIIKMPVDCIIDHPGFIVMGPAARGMLMTIVLFHWQTGFKRFMITGHELFAIARAHPQAWSKYRADILNILNDIRPELERSYAYDSAVYESQRAHALAIRSLSSRRRLDEKQVNHGSREEARTVRSVEEREAAPPARAGEERPKFRRRTMG